MNTPVYAVANRWPQKGYVEVITYNRDYRCLGKRTMPQTEADTLSVEWLSPLQVFRGTNGTMGLPTP